MRTLMVILLMMPSLLFASKIETIELNSKNTINFNQAFTGMYVASKQIEAIDLCSKNPGTEIFITLYTPGGSISAGKLFFDTLNALDCTFNTITIFSASMGYQTVQNLGRRLIIPSGVLMSHRASVRGLGGEIGGELDSIYNLIKQNVKDMEISASKRVGITLDQYKKDISDELWLTANKAVETNHADSVVLIRCDKSLLTTRFELVRTFFGTFNVEFSNCPIITAPISVGSGVDNVKIINYYNDLSKHIEYTL